MRPAHFLPLHVACLLCLPVATSQQAYGSLYKIMTDGHLSDEQLWLEDCICRSHYPGVATAHDSALTDLSSASAHSEAPAWARRSSCVWALCDVGGPVPSLRETELNISKPSLEATHPGACWSSWQGDFIPQEGCSPSKRSSQSSCGDGSLTQKEWPVILEVTRGV